MIRRTLPVRSVIAAFAVTVCLAAAGWAAEGPKRIFFVPGEDPEVFLFEKPFGEGAVVKTLYRWGVFVDDEGKRDRLYLLEEAAPSSGKAGWSKVRHEFACTFNGKPMTLVGTGWVKSSEIESERDHQRRVGRLKPHREAKQKKKTSPERKKGVRELKKEHPEWGDDTLKAIAKGKVSLGMTSDQVKLAWGEPVHRSQEMTKRGKRDLWRYSMGEHLYFQRGVLMVIRLNFR